MYLELEFKSAGFWNKNTKDAKKHTVNIENGKAINNDLIINENDNEIILKSNVINLLHVLVDKRPVPLNRKVNCDYDKNILSFKDDIYVKINNLNTNSVNDIYFNSTIESIHTNKAQYNSFVANTNRTWRGLKKLLTYNNNLHVIDNINEIIEKYIPLNNDIKLHDLGIILKLGKINTKQPNIKISYEELIENRKDYNFIDEIVRVDKYIELFSKEKNKESVDKLLNLSNIPLDKNTYKAYNREIKYIFTILDDIKPLNRNINKFIHPSYIENKNNIINKIYEEISKICNGYIINFIMEGTCWGDKKNPNTNTIKNGITKDSFSKLNGKILVKVNQEYINELHKSSRCATFLDDGIIKIKNIIPTNKFNKNNYIKLTDNKLKIK